jgi:hypothetical protein
MRRRSTSRSRADDVATRDAADQMVEVMEGDDGKLRQLELREAPHHFVERRSRRDARDVPHEIDRGQAVAPPRRVRDLERIA